MSGIVEKILALYERHGGIAYGEDVTMREHALQCAGLAQSDGAAPELVAAALLHDVGHLIEEADDEYGYHRHDRSGAEFLAAHFPPAVVAPVRLHVAAKRYLCATENDYFARLSPASVHSLEMQGGPMSRDEARAFESEPHHEAAVRLRRWDEDAKVAGAATLELVRYRDLLERLTSA